MLFNSLDFVWFLVVAVILHRIIPARRNALFITIASYVFYGWWDWRFLFLIFGSTFFNYLLALGISRTENHTGRNYLLILSIVANLGLLAFFKYAEFLLDNVRLIAASFGWMLPKQELGIILPVGISFFTFQTLSYVIDVWRGDIKAETRLDVFAAFVAFFPQLVAGPIERATELLPQIQEKRVPSLSQIERGVWPVLWGLLLKVFLADNLSLLSDHCYANLETCSGLDLVLCHYAFALQIFGDFAGYSFIALGISRLFGIELSINFRFPYFVTNPSEFWRHWHISLSQWLRDYLYIPLGGNRVSRGRTYANLILTMLLGGLWHGASWMFVLWGLFHGLLLAIYHGITTANQGKQLPGNFLSRAACGLLMFHLVCIGWMLFRSPSLQSTLTILRQSYTNPFDVTRNTIPLACFLLFYGTIPAIIHFLQFLRGRDQEAPLDSDWGRASLYGAVVFLLVGFGDWGNSSFIYFQF